MCEKLKELILRDCKGDERPEYVVFCNNDRIYHIDNNQHIIFVSGQKYTVSAPTSPSFLKGSVVLVKELKILAWTSDFDLFDFNIGL